MSAAPFLGVPRPHCGRCDRCGWPFAEDPRHGCLPDECSQRPGVPLRDTCAGCGAPFDDVAPAPEPEIVRLRRENAALHQYRRAVIGFLSDVRRDRDRADVLIRAGTEFREHGFAERPTLPDLAAAALPDDDEPSAGDAILVDTPAPPMPIRGTDGC